MLCLWLLWLATETSAQRLQSRDWDGNTYYLNISSPNVRQTPEGEKFLHEGGPWEDDLRLYAEYQNVITQTALPRHMHDFDPRSEFRLRSWDFHLYDLDLSFIYEACVIFNASDATMDMIYATQLNLFFPGLSPQYFNASKFGDGELCHAYTRNAINVLPAMRGIPRFWTPRVALKFSLQCPDENPVWDPLWDRSCLAFLNDSVTMGELAPLLKLRLSRVATRQYAWWVWENKWCSPHQDCCGEVVEIDLQALGFDFVHYPRRFKSLMCHGRCGIEKGWSMTMGYYNKTTGLQWRRSCVPIEFSPLQVVMSDPDYTNTRNTIIPRMIVTRCGCNWDPMRVYGSDGVSHRFPDD